MVGRSGDEAGETVLGWVADDKRLVGEMGLDRPAEDSKVIAGVYSPVGKERRSVGEGGGDGEDKTPARSAEFEGQAGDSGDEDQAKSFKVVTGVGSPVGKERGSICKSGDDGGDDALKVRLNP